MRNFNIITNQFGHYTTLIGFAKDQLDSVMARLLNMEAITFATIVGFNKDGQSKMITYKKTEQENGTFWIKQA